MFCDLQEKLFREYPNTKFPQSSIQFIAKTIREINNSRKETIEERRKNLQQYLTDLSLISAIRQSAVFARFLGMDKECPEEYTLISSSSSYFYTKELLE